jgi:hypothetical protein
MKLDSFLIQLIFYVIQKEILQSAKGTKAEKIIETVFSVINLIMPQKIDEVSRHLLTNYIHLSAEKIAEIDMTTGNPEENINLAMHRAKEKLPLRFAEMHLNTLAMIKTTPKVSKTTISKATV